jgi:hypothetical protein
VAILLPQTAIPSASISISVHCCTISASHSSR